jgi:EmrB/QacA subfamily drug resistance transporter
MLLAAAFFLEEIDATIIATSLPQMATSLGVDTSRMSMAMSAYLLSVAIMLPVGGWLANRFGARRMYCLALSIFTVGSALCGSATSLPTLLLGRAIQGTGGAWMTSLGRLIVVRTFPKDRLVVATNYMIAPALLGSTFGPVVGGFVTTYFSWRWNFFVSVPLGLLTLGATLIWIKPIAPQPTQDFDWRGFGLIAAAMVAAQLTMGQIGSHAVIETLRAIFLVLTVLLIGAYVWHAHNNPLALLDLQLLRMRTFAVAVYAGGIARIASGALPFVLPLLFQLGFGLDPLHSGLLTVGMTCGQFVTRAGMGGFLRRFRVRNLLVLNGLVLALLVAGLICVHSRTPRTAIFLYLFVLGALRSTQLSSVTALGYADVSHERLSDANTLLTLSARFSVSCGIGIAAAALGALAGHNNPVPQDFFVVLLGLAGLMAASALGFSRLRVEDGWQLARGRSN